MGADRALSAGYVFGALALVWIGGCSHSTQATAVTVDPKAVTGIRTFVITAPPPRVSRMAPDFQVAYYAGTGQVVDTRAYKTGYYGRYSDL